MLPSNSVFSHCEAAQRLTQRLSDTQNPTLKLSLSVVSISLPASETGKLTHKALIQYCDSAALLSASLSERYHTHSLGVNIGVNTKPSKLAALPSLTHKAQEEDTYNVSLPHESCRVTGGAYSQVSLCENKDGYP